MPSIFNNKKTYLRRKSLRLYNKLIVFSFPALLLLGAYAFYHRSPHNKKFVTTLTESSNAIRDKMIYHF